jgi:acyl carrier protein
VTFDEFVDFLRTTMRVDIPDDASPYTGLYDDLGLDSFKAFELLIICESLAENVVPPETIPELYTLGDAFAYYEDLRDNAGDLTGP